MLLEKILREGEEDLSEIPRLELQQRIMETFSGIDRTNAVMEYAAIFRNYKHRDWIRNIRAASESGDIAEFLQEWQLGGTATHPAIFSRLGGTKCECDGVGIKTVYVFDNSKRARQLRVGSTCADKIQTQNVFGDTMGRYGGNHEGHGDEVLLSAIEWLDSYEGSPAEIKEMICKLKSGAEGEEGEISLREREILMRFYDNTRLFHPSELVGDRELRTLRETFERIRTVLPRDLDAIIFTNDQVTRHDAQPLFDFVYSNHSDLIQKLRSDSRIRETIRRERAQLNVRFPDLEKMGRKLLSYMNDYYDINGHQKHGLTGLEMPIRLFNGGFLMTEEDAREIQRAYEMHRGYTPEQLENQRDERFRKQRTRKWADVNRRDRGRLVDKFVDAVYNELVTMAVKEKSELGEDIWRVINGVMKSKITGSKTGYLPFQQMRSDGRTDLARRNLREFLFAGYVGGDIPYRDRLFYDVNARGNLPETLMGSYTQYEIPKDVEDVALNDARSHPNRRTADQLNKTRTEALGIFRGIVMEQVRRFKFR
jgi:hypothetical protein